MTTNCDIREHAWLVLELDDFLDCCDPMGNVGERIRAHEYLPEIPDLISLLVAGEAITDDVSAVFEKFFGAGYAPPARMQEITDGINEVRRSWIDLLGRIDRTWNGSGVLWTDISVQDFSGDGNYFALLQVATIPGVDHESRTFENCTSLEDAVARVLAYDRERFGEHSASGN